jgi:hypothetical protein
MSDATLRSKLIRLAHENPNLRPDLLPLLSKRGSDEMKTAGTLRYDGDTAIDKVYAMTDLLGEAVKMVDGLRTTSEVKAARAALENLEKVVEKLSK